MMDSMYDILFSESVKDLKNMLRLVSVGRSLGIAVSGLFTTAEMSFSESLLWEEIVLAVDRSLSRWDSAPDSMSSSEPA